MLLFAKIEVICIKIKLAFAVLAFSIVKTMLAYAEEPSDMFEVIKLYASNNKSITTNVEIISNGVSINNIINKKAEEKYIVAINNKYKNSSILENNITSENSTVFEDSYNDTNSNNTSSNKDEYSSYFAGTTDFTNLSSSRRDALLNGWSAIRDSYNKYDDLGEDNITIIATAYTSSAEENGGWAGLNAIGGKLGPGCIAAPKDIAFHTKIRISGLGIFNVEDRGGAIVRINENTIRVDVWMASYKEAMNFGKRIYKGRILT